MKDKEMTVAARDLKANDVIIGGPLRSHYLIHVERIEQIGDEIIIILADGHEFTANKNREFSVSRMA